MKKELVFVVMFISIFFQLSFIIPLSLESCAREGELIGGMIYPEKKCCNGLEPLSKLYYDELNMKCQIGADEGEETCVSSRCGDLVCQGLENKCNCPRDCETDEGNYACPFGELDSSTCSEGVEISKCFLNNKTVYQFAMNVYDGGSVLSDSNGNPLGECVNGLSGNIVGKCLNLNFSNCEVVYRTAPNIWGTPVVNVNNCNPCLEENRLKCETFQDCVQPDCDSIECPHSECIDGNCKLKKYCPKDTEEKNGTCARELSNGRNAEVKIMPSVASETAIQKLGELGFNITLKEVGKGDDTKLIYELEAEKEGKIFGLFRAKGKVQALINAETGEVEKINKPWWAFLASGI